MMEQIKLLTLLELKGLYGLNVIRHTKDRRAIKRYRLLSVVWLLVAFVLLFYVGGISYGFARLGLTAVIPVCLGLLASFVILGIGILRAGSVIFSSKGYDMLCALPVSQTAIVVSRFFRMYIEDLLWTLLFFVPGMVVYGVFVMPAFGFYLTGVLGILIIPLLPLTVSVILGTVVAALAGRMRHKALAQTILTLLLLIFIFLASAAVGRMTEGVSLDELQVLMQKLEPVLCRVYAPAAWLGKAMTGGEVTSLLKFIGSSFAAFGVMVWWVAGHFHKICRRLFAVSSTQSSGKKNPEKEEMVKLEEGAIKQGSLRRALYIKELRRYFSSSIYVTNTIMGPVLSVIMAAALSFTGVEKLQVMLKLPVSLEGIIPFFLAAVMGMMTCTSVSISMEGKNFWLVKTLPVSTGQLLDAKLWMNLSLMLPFYVVAELLLILAFRPAMAELFWMLIIPATLLSFSCVFGLTVNLHLYHLQWDKEETVVKQSSSALIGGFATPVLSILFGLLVLLAPAPFENLIKGLMCALVVLVTFFFYNRNKKARLWWRD